MMIFTLNIVVPEERASHSPVASTTDWERELEVVASYLGFAVTKQQRHQE